MATCTSMSWRLRAPSLRLPSPRLCQWHVRDMTWCHRHVTHDVSLAFKHALHNSRDSDSDSTWERDTSYFNRVTTLRVMHVSGLVVSRHTWGSSCESLHVPWALPCAGVYFGGERAHRSEGRRPDSSSCPCPQHDSGTKTIKIAILTLLDVNM